jgi:acetylornithine deacetylase/succinyl-diaminopimelate desuccinylase-like protein
VTVRADPLAGLDETRRRWTEQAWARIDRKRLRDLITAMVDIASPTGDEAPLARHITQTLAERGIESHTMYLDDRQANSWGRLRGDGTGPDLLLYAPIDTVTSGNVEEDLPWAAETLRPDLTARAVADDDYVIGLGASNPKGHAACVQAAVEAIRAAELPLTGDLLVGFGAGGMPTNARPGVGNPRRNTGQGVGCSFLLEQGVWADFALIAKPGWTVSWEEVGLSWFEITVHGARRRGCAATGTLVSGVLGRAPRRAGVAAGHGRQHSRRLGAHRVVHPAIGADDGGSAAEPAYDADGRET